MPALCPAARHGLGYGNPFCLVEQAEAHRRKGTDHEDVDREDGEEPRAALDEVKDLGDKGAVDDPDRVRLKEDGRQDSR